MATIRDRRDNFITVVPIAEQATQRANEFVTVLEVKTPPAGMPVPNFPAPVAPETLDHATIYRLPGERLGMALKFVGGTNAGDTVSKVYIQSINPESPASRAQSKVAPIREGDEILKIGERDVTSMTRLDCVTLLRDSPVCINLIIRHMSGQTPPEVPESKLKREPPPIPPRKSSIDPPTNLVKSPSTKSLDRVNVTVRRPSMPPPLPPRKGKIDDSSITIANRPQSVPPLIHHEPQKSDSSDEVDFKRVLVQRTRSAPSSDERPRFIKPPEPEAYTDLFACDDSYMESESDDTASSVSTVIERLHSRSSTANSSFSEHAYGGYDRPSVVRLDLEKVFHPLVDMERRTPEVPPRPSMNKHHIVEEEEPLEMSETPDPEPAGESDDLIDTHDRHGDNQCHIIAAKCSNTPHIQNGEAEGTPLIAETTVHLLDKPDLEPIIVTDLPAIPPRHDLSHEEGSASSSEEDVISMERCSPSGDSFNSSSSAASVVDANTPPLVGLATPPPIEVASLPPGVTLQVAEVAPKVAKCMKDGYFEDDTRPFLEQVVKTERSTLQSSSPALHDIGQETEPSTRQSIDDTLVGDGPDVTISVEVPTSGRVESGEVIKEKAPTPEEADKKESMIAVTYGTSGRLPPDGHEFPQTFDDPKGWKSEVFRGRSSLDKSLSVDDSGVFCSTPSSDESHSPTNKSPSPSFSTENLFPNHYNSPITEGTRRGSVSSVYSKYREASQKRYCGLLMSMLEPSSEPKSKLKGLVLNNKPETASASQSKILPVIVSNPVVVKVESVPVAINKAMAPEPIVVPKAALEQRSSAPPTGAFKAPTYKRSLGLTYSDIGEQFARSRPPPPPPVPSSPPSLFQKGSDILIERYLNSFEEDDKNLPNRAVSCANLKDADLFAKSSIGETRSKWQSMEFQAVQPPATAPPPIPPRPSSRTEPRVSNNFGNLKPAKSEAALNIQSNGSQETTGVSGPQNFRALAAKWEERSSQDLAPPIPARKLSDPSVRAMVPPKPASRVTSLASEDAQRKAVQSISNGLAAASVKPAPRSTSENKKTFEEVQKPLRNGEHRRFSSIDSNDSGNSSVSNREQYSSLTSLASTTSSTLISPQDLQQLIEEANQSLEEEGQSSQLHDIYVVVLHKDSPTGGAGITLAGGSDYESKEITVHKIVSNSAADRDGRIRRGDRMLSINGKSLKSATHREALEILKSPRPELVLVLSRDNSGRNSSAARSSLSRASSLSSVLDVIDEPGDRVDGTTPQFEGGIIIVLEKDKVGLGFTLQGGKDSPLGNKPLTINRIFSCGAAERDGRLQPGDELLAINATVTSAMTRTEAWNFLKKLPEGRISFTVRQQQSR